MKLIALTLILAFFHLLVPGQKIGFDEIDNSKVKPWKAANEKDYQFVYHFGDSEMESDFLLMHTKKGWFGQIKSGTWDDMGKKWISIYQNLENLEVKGHNFFSSKSDGEFVTYMNGQKLQKGLKLYNSWSGLTEKGEYEIGLKSYPIADYFPGDYPLASMQFLEAGELSQYSKKELKIMRNEIFARYGYIFREGGEMDRYFRDKDWYSAQHVNVDDFLTAIEKANIRLILEAEKE
jgi:hypothetical protein